MFSAAIGRRNYPCGCSAAGGSDLPYYCPEHGAPPPGEDLPEVPCCPVHESLWRRGAVKPLDNCFVCIRNERDELRALIAEAAAFIHEGFTRCNVEGGLALHARLTAIAAPKEAI